MAPGNLPLKVLLVDDEPQFREALAERLVLRGLDVQQSGDGEDAVRRVRQDPSIDVVVLDRKMPGMDGAQTLQEIKSFRSEIQVIMLTGYGSVESATEAGKLGAYRYLAKPVATHDLVKAIRSAAREKTHALARHNMPVRKHPGWRSRLLGSANSRPLIMLLGLAFMLAAWLAPPPQGLVRLLDTPKSGHRAIDVIAGYPEYGAMNDGQTIAQFVRAHYRPPGLWDGPDLARDAAGRAQLMIGLIVIAAMFWATGAVPIGITALVVATVMYVGGIMRPDGITQAFAKDSVVFIFGVLVLSRVISGTGLDRRLAMFLLGPVRGFGRLLFVFLPLFAVACSFISETILIALMMPLFVAVYRETVPGQGQAKGEDRQRQLLVLFALMLCYASNLGGPGSPAAGGRNAVMVGILTDYGKAPTFAQWMQYGMPFVPVAALVLAMYFYVAFRGRLRAAFPEGLNLDVAGIARRNSRRLGPMNRDEHVTAAVGILVVALWVFGGSRLGMGGPVLLGLVLLNIAGVLKWTEIPKIHWDVVFLYAGASALGKGLAMTGGALYLARGFVLMLPEGLTDGTALGGSIGNAGLAMAVSFLTGLVTNLMSDGATVAAIGPIAVPMAQSAGVHPWMVGFATAFASSFPHMLIIGTPANALVYILCKDPRTGRQLVTQGDFLRHGVIVFVLSFAVLWFWAFLGYWRWLGFPG